MTRFNFFLLIVLLLINLFLFFLNISNKKRWAEEANVSNNSITWVTVFKYFIWVFFIFIKHYEYTFFYFSHLL